jgi:hypothetical protein
MSNYTASPYISDLVQASNKSTAKDLLDLYSPEGILSITKTGNWFPRSPFPFYQITFPSSFQIGDTFLVYKGKWANQINYSEPNWATGQDRITSLSFDDLEGVVTTINMTNVNGLTSLSFPQLKHISSMSLSNMSSITTLTMPEIKYGAISLSNMPSTTSISFPSLIGVTGNLSISNMISLTSASFPVLDFIDGLFSFGTLNSLTSVSFPVLTRIGGDFTPATSQLTVMSLPLLKRIDGFFSPSVGAANYTVSVPSLEVVNGSIQMITNSPAVIYFPSLKYTAAIAGNGYRATSLTFPSLEFINGNINLVNSMTSLTTFTLPVDGKLKNVNGNVTINGGITALNVASVDNVLLALSTLDGTNNTTVYGSGRTVNLSGASNAAPSNLGSTTTPGSNFVCSGTTCTVNMTNHGYSNGDVLRVSGITTATNANRYAVITVVNSNQFTYTISSQNATGAGTATVIKAGNSVKALITRGVSLTTN